MRRLRDAGFEVDLSISISQNRLVEVVADYDVLIVRDRTKITREIIEVADRLKIIGRVGVGLDNIDLRTAERRNIKVLNTPGVVADAVAELTIGLMISLARSIPLADGAMKKGRWIKGELIGWELKGKTLGIIGLGNIGRRVARIAKALGMNILIAKRTPPNANLLEDLKGEFVSLSELLKRSDVVSIHVPLTEQTQHMIGTHDFLLMEKGAFIINTSRGGVLDEEALLQALRSRRLAGAALDVYETEPPMKQDLVKLPNVVSTCHIGSQTYEAQRAAAMLMAEMIINTFDGLSENGKTRSQSHKVHSTGAR